MLCFTLVAGCASTRLVLEKPLSDQCTSAGLKGCPELTEGVLDYVDGDQAGGDAKLDAGIRKNAAGKLKEFADSLQGLESLPGSDSFMGPLRQVIAKIESGSEDAAPAPESQRNERAADRRRPADDPAAEDSDDQQDPAQSTAAPAARASNPYADDAGTPAGKPTAPAAPGIDMAHLAGGTVMAASDAAGGPCDAPSKLVPGVSAKSFCTKAVAGPIVITDIHAGGACPVDVELVIGDFSAARMVIPVPAHTPVHATGARLAIGPLEVLSVVALKTTDTAAANARCAITWSGWKP